MADLSRFKQVNLVDFEFGSAPGSHPAPVCVVFHDLVSGRRQRIRQDELLRMPAPPYDCGPNSLFVAYYSSAELTCHIALGWPMPRNILDLFAEFRCETNGTGQRASLLDALVFFGLPAISAAEKTAMRDLILGGGPWSEEEWAAILDYCQSDVDALALLLPALLPRVNLELALIRGRFMSAAASMESTGVPIDVELLDRLRLRWDDIQGDVIREMDVDGIYDEDGSFRVEWWEQWLIKNGIPWPRLKSGSLALDKDSFKAMSETYPAVMPIKELRKTLSQITHLYSLNIGPDRRNRCLLSAFGASTGRNTPKAKEFIFNKPAWFRGLIKPEPGIGLAYIDYSQQELAIAAFLSGDLAMQRAYLSGDFYIGAAIEAGAAPPGATKHSHPAIREAFKSVSLGTLYGMGPALLAQKIGQPLYAARDLLELHRRTFKTYWEWSTRIMDTAALTRELHTRLGWKLHLGGSVPRSPGSIGNFPVQANASEMLRLACIAATEAGISVCAPIHDALLVEAPVAELPDVVAKTKELMAAAGAAILGGQPLRSDAKLVLPPGRYEDPKGAHMWKVVMGAMGRLK